MSLTAPSADEKSPVQSQVVLGSGAGSPKQAGATTMATINDDDERLLAQIGYEQVSSTPNIPCPDPASNTCHRNSLVTSPDTQPCPTPSRSWES